MSENLPTIQHKRGTKDDMTSLSPLLAEGEFGVETDTYKIKVGDGTKSWNDLPYVGAGPRVDTRVNWEAGLNYPLSPKELAVAYVPNDDYTADIAKGQYTVKINQSPTDKYEWNDTSYVTVVPLVPSNTRGINGATAITNMVSMTGTQYIALAVKNPSTLYIIVD
jgi:hypothetical protein